jgi:hypothetical protein
MPEAPALGVVRMTRAIVVAPSMRQRPQRQRRPGVAVEGVAGVVRPGRLADRLEAAPARRSEALVIEIADAEAGQLHERAVAAEHLVERRAGRPLGHAFIEPGLLELVRGEQALEVLVGELVDGDDLRSKKDRRTRY